MYVTLLGRNYELLPTGDKAKGTITIIQKGVTIHVFTLNKMIRITM